jgi:hypothetical protein
MFTASLNLEALKQATQGPDRICAAEGCEKPVASRAGQRPVLLRPLERSDEAGATGEEGPPLG